MDICGKPMLWHVLSRAKRIEGVNEVILTVPVGESPIFLEIAYPLGVCVIEGPHPDLLASYYLTAQEAGADVVMRITSDCPTIDPELCGRVLKMFLDYYSKEPLVGPFVYAISRSDIIPESNYPDGLDCEVFSMDALSQANRQATEDFDRHHATPWIVRHSNPMYLKIDDPKIRERCKGLLWSVNTQADLDQVRSIMSRVKSTNWMDALRAYEEVR
jgi:spore coat polysaccharide biosynthesis protein SpsF (cytidylyltransferase family)